MKTVKLLAAGLIGCLLITGQLAFSQASPGEIHGSAFLDDAKTDPASFANVTLDVNGEVRGVAADIDGKFKIKPLAPGVYNVKISYVGGYSKEIMGVQVRADAITFLRNEVLVMDNNLKGIDVVARSIYTPPQIDIEDPVRIDIPLEQIKHNPNKFDAMEVVANSTSEIKKKADGQLYFKGARSDAMVTFIDGVKVRGGTASVPSKAIMNVQVYTGGLPAKYGDTTGGVVAIETMSYMDLYRLRNMGKL